LGFVADAVFDSFRHHRLLAWFGGKLAYSTSEALYSILAVGSDLLILRHI
jgi:hypothetical protein